MHSSHQTLPRYLKIGLMINCLDVETIALFRPVGPRELDLIRESGYREFPPRLPSRPVFYPVPTEEYAIQIARDWNAEDASTGYHGYVTRFRVPAEFL
jgi:hypothetical protein